MAGVPARRGGAAALAATEAIDREPRPATVVGCGNWLMRSDRLGPRVLASLGQRAAPDVEIEDVGVSVLGLLDRLRGQELLVLVDACLGLAEPGAVLVRQPEAEAPLLPPSSTHQIGPLETLAIARELYPERLPRRIVLVLVETEGLDEPGEAAACRRAVAVVEQQIAAWRVGGQQEGAGSRAE